MITGSIMRQRMLQRSASEVMLHLTRCTGILMTRSIPGQTLQATVFLPDNHKKGAFKSLSGKAMPIGLGLMSGQLGAIARRSITEI
jgi:hypothetical protein